MSELSRARLCELERIHILRTIIRLDNGSGVPGALIAENASEECDHDAFDELPSISARGIGQKLSAMSLDGLVKADYDEDHRLRFWSVTAAGRELAERDPYDTAPAADGARALLAAALENVRTVNEQPINNEIETLLDQANANLVHAIRELDRAGEGRA